MHTQLPLRQAPQTPHCSWNLHESPGVQSLTAHGTQPPMSQGQTCLVAPHWTKLRLPEQLATVQGSELS